MLVEVGGEQGEMAADDQREVRPGLRSRGASETLAMSQSGWAVSASRVGVAKRRSTIGPDRLHTSVDSRRGESLRYR